MKVLVTADESGTVKELVFNRGVDTSKKDGPQPTEVSTVFEKQEDISLKSRIIRLQQYQDYFLAARLDGTLRVHSTTKNEEGFYDLIHTYTLAQPRDKPVSLSVVDEFAVVAYELSQVFVVWLKDLKKEALSVKVEGWKNNTTIEAFEANPYEDGVFAYGGKENDLKIVRLFEVSKLKKAFKAESLSTEVIFTAKNVPFDHLGLRVPVWISQIKFFKDSDKDAYKLITATRKGQVRQYDTSVGERPTCDYRVSEKPLMQLAFANADQTEVIVADNHNYVAKLSLTKIDPKGYQIRTATAGILHRPTPKVLGKFSEGGNTGAIHGVETNFKSNIVAFGGLDRYLRVFDLEKRTLVAKVYAATQISDILVLEADDEDESKKTEESDEEDVWDKLDELAKPKKRKVEEDEEKEKKSKKSKKSKK